MGRFESGQNKPAGSGRKKGTVNKKSQLLEEIFDSNGFCIPEQLIKLLPELDPAKQADILLDLMSYLYPKRKAADVSATRNVDNKIEITFVGAKDGKPCCDHAASLSNST